MLTSYILNVKFDVLITNSCWILLTLDVLRGEDDFCLSYRIEMLEGSTLTLKISQYLCSHGTKSLNNIPFYCQ